MSKYFDIFAYLMGKQAGGGGGGGDITVESKSINANGTYTAPPGKAYSPVTVSVPNSYAAGDEGKVVSNGALVAQGSDSVTQNGTVDTTLINSLNVNVSGGGGGLEYEAGTWTPASDVSTQLLYFQNTHSQCPMMFCISDVTGNTPDAYSNLAQAVIDWSKFAAEPIISTASVSYYGREQHYYHSGSSAMTGGTGISYPSSNPSDSTSSYARFWATETYIRANINSNVHYWRSGRTYKWIAVWAPTA